MCAICVGRGDRYLQNIFWVVTSSSRCFCCCCYRTTQPPTPPKHSRTTGADARDAKNLVGDVDASARRLLEQLLAPLPLRPQRLFGRRWRGLGRADGVPAVAGGGEGVEGWGDDGRSVGSRSLVRGLDPTSVAALIGLQVGWDSFSAVRFGDGGGGERGQMRICCPSVFFRQCVCRPKLNLFAAAAVYKNMSLFVTWQGFYKFVAAFFLGHVHKNSHVISANAQ